jgi:C4-dicarboxylate transporter DctM subunit
VTARRRNLPRTGNWSFRELIASFWSALPSLGLPAIIVGGILSGAFTPTESAGVAAVYTIVLGLFYRKLSWRIFYPVVDVGSTTGAVMLVIGVSGIFSWFLISQDIGQDIVDGLVGLTTNKTVMMLLIASMLFVLGFFMEMLAVLVLAIPVLMPLITQIGIDPVVFGVVSTIALTTGLVTPPFGLTMFLMCRMADIRIEDFAREMLPFLIAMIGTIFLLILVPDLVTWIPDHLLGAAN